MSDPGKKENNDNPSKISEILADFFLKKIDMPYASDDSDRLHKSKKKKSKHKKRKHKKYKHRHRSSSSDSRTKLNIKGVDDFSSSEEMGIKRLKKIKNIKMQSVKSLVLQSASSFSSPSEIKNVKSNDSSGEKPVFYGPSLELLLTGTNNNLNVDSNPNLISSKDLHSDDKKMPENEIKTELKETKNSFQENSDESCNKDSKVARPPNVSLECSNASSSTKGNCDNNNEVNSTHTTTTIFNDIKDIKKDNFKTIVKKENDFQSVFDEKESKTVSLTDCKIVIKKEEPEVNILKNELKTEIKNEECTSDINENHSKTSVEEKKYVSEVKKEKTDDSKEVSVDCMNIKLDHSKSLPKISETVKKESKEDCIKSKSVNNEKSKSDSNHKKDANNYVTKPKKNDSNRKHSKSRSRSASPSNHTSSRSKHKRHKSRSSSRDSYHSKKKKKQRSRSRSHSHGKTRSRNYRRRSYSRSYSRSRSRSRHKRNRRKSHSRSPYKRSNRRRSRSRSYNRSKELSRRTRRRSKSREHHYSSSKYHDRSRSRKRSSRSKSRSKSHHKSISPKKSHSRSKSKEKKSSSEKSNKIDQAKILETARRNVLQMIKKGTLPDGLPIENLKKEQLLSIQAGGKSVQELTDFCQRLSQKENEPEHSDNEDKEDKADDETGFIHHPFKVKEPGIIKLNIKNAIQLPIKTHAQKIAETTRLSSQFPVSSGNKHRQKELEWIPVVPESSKTETKSTASTVSTVAENSTAIVPAVSVESSVISIPPPPPPPAPVAYPCPPPPEAMPVATAVPVPSVLPSTVSLPSIPPPPLPPIVQSTTVYQTHQPIVPSYVVPSQKVMIPTASVAAATPSTSIFNPPKKLHIPSIMVKRATAVRKLNENPNDIDALKLLQETEASVQDWVESVQVPGMFTGSTDVKLLTVDELSGPFKYRNRKKIEFFSLLEIILIE